MDKPKRVAIYIRVSTETQKTDMQISDLKDHTDRRGYEIYRIYEEKVSAAAKKRPEFEQMMEEVKKDSEKGQIIPAGMNWFQGDATLDENLKSAGIEKARAIIITTPSDASNVFITLTARHLNENLMIIARALIKETEKKLYRAGADNVIMPDMLGGMFMAQLDEQTDIQTQHMKTITATDGL